MKTVGICLMCLLFAIPAHAQQGASGSQDSSVIHGREHPELIPDAVMMRLFFVQIGKPNQDFDEQRIDSRLQSIGFDSSDRLVIKAELMTFRQQYGEFLTKFKDQRPTDNDIRLRDEIVDRMYRHLQSLLSSDGLKRFDNYIQSEKKFVSIKGGQQ